MKLYALFISFIFLALFSCLPSHHYVQNRDCLVDSIVLIKEPDEFFGSVAFAHDARNVFVYVYSPHNGKIYALKDDHQYVDSFALPKMFRQTAFNFYVDRQQNLVYILRLGENAIYAVRDTLLVGRYEYHSKAKFGLYSVQSNFRVFDNTVVLNKIPIVEDFENANRQKYYTSKTLSLFKLSNDSLVETNNFLNFPQAYLKDIYHDVFPYYYRINKDSIVYLFNLSDRLGIYDMRTDRDMSCDIAGFTPNKITPSNKDSFHFVAYNARKALENESFINILFDDNTGRLIITQSLKLSAQNKSSLYNPLVIDKPVLVNLISGQNVAKKIYFPNQSNDWFINSFFFKNKLYVRNKIRNVIYVYSLEG